MILHKAAAYADLYLANPKSFSILNIARIKYSFIRSDIEVKGLSFHLMCQ